MPAILFDPSKLTKDLCYNCNEPALDENPHRRCSRCGIARYCSPQCQRANWPVHRQTCMDHKANLSTYAVSNMEEEVNDFTRWHKVWRDALLVWGTFAADLANEPRDFLLNHSYFLSLQRQSNRSARAKYQAVWGGMRPDTEILADLQRIADAEYRQQIVNNFQSMPRQQEALRITVAVPAMGLFSNLGGMISEIFPDRQARAFTDPRSVDARLLSTALVAAWSSTFPEYLQTGNSSGHSQILRDLTQAANTAADLD
ncbi:hypothetical protein FB451DRAFT_1806 [Mycena latifolia]|nr:hypothetical protein FB451DRAFT_1806 [Mycena latifolia]